MATLSNRGQIAQNITDTVAEDYALAHAACCITDDIQTVVCPDGTKALVRSRIFTHTACFRSDGSVSILAVIVS